MNVSRASTDVARRPSLEDLLAQPATAFVLFASMALAATWPLVRRFTETLPFGSADLWQNYWNLWWWKKAIFELGASPYSTDLLFYPGGADLVFHTHSSFNMIASLPVNLLFGPAAAYNFCFLLALTLSGFATWLLVRELTGDARAAVLAGIVYAFFPQRMEQSFEHLNLFSTQFIPWSLFYLVKLLREGGRRNAVGLGVCFGFNALCSWHLGLMLAMTLPFAAAFLAPRETPWRGRLGGLALACAVATLIVAPAVWPLAQGMGGEDGYYRKPAVDRGIDASFLLTPHYGHPLFGSLVAESYADGAYLAAGFVCYLGFLPLALAAWAIWRRRPGALFWALYALAGVILSLGERPLWRGELLEELTLPFAAIKYLPVLDLLRVANRFLLPASLGLAAAAAYGWLALPRRTNAIFALLACGIFFEYLWAPFPVREVDLPAAYDALAEAPPGAVIDVPFFQRSRTAIDMVGQTRHGRPIVAGYLSTDAPETVAMLRKEPALADLVDIPKLERPIDFERLRELGFVAFEVHKDRAESYGSRLLETVDPTNMPARKNASRFGGIPDETIGEILRQLNEESGAPIFEDERTAIFLLSPGA